jgi:hypothetical protein
MRRWLPLVMLGLVACSSAAPRSPAASSPSTAASTAEVLARIRATPLAELAGAAGDLEVAVAEVEQVTAALWARYRAEVAADPARRAARAQQALPHGDVVMRYREETIGARPPEGLPAVPRAPRRRRRAAGAQRRSVGADAALLPGQRRRRGLPRAARRQRHLGPALPPGRRMRSTTG